MQHPHRVALHSTVGRFACKQNRGPDILLLVRSPTLLGGQAWTPQQYSAPIRTVLPEAKLARAILASIGGRNRGGICHLCHKTLSATTGTVFDRLRTSAETVVMVVALLAHGCPVQALVAACGFDEWTVADWWARSGRQGQAVHESLVEQPRDLGQVHADEMRVKKQGSIVWMALAMMVKTRVWLGGEVSEQRDMPLIRRLIVRVRRCAARRPLLICTAGLVAYIRAIRATLRDPVPTGTGGRPRRRPWPQVLIAPVAKRYERRRVVEAERRIVDGPPARVETLRCRSQGDGVINTAYMEPTQRHVPGTPRAHWRAAARRWHATPGHCTRGCSWSAPSITCVRLMRVYPIFQRQQRRPWRRGSRTSAGRCTNCCRFMCCCCDGHRPNNVGVPHMHSNVLWSGGAGTTVSCGATHSTQE